MALNIIFMGTPEFAVPALKGIAKSSHKILEVYTQPAKKKDRGQKIQNSPIYDCAEQLNLKLRCPTSLDTQDEFDHFKNLKPDLVIVVAYGKIIPKNFLSLVKMGFLNIHASLLPKWRGAAPIQRSIMNKDAETGITIMKIDEGLDSGPILGQAKIAINENTDAEILSKILSQLGTKKLLEVINSLPESLKNSKSQDHSQASYAKKISKSESKILWNQDAKNIIAKINGLNPSPGAWFNFGNDRYKIWKASATELKGNPGEVLDENLTVGCKIGSIKILSIQKEGKSKLSANEFLLGTKIKKGNTLG